MRLRHASVLCKELPENCATKQKLRGDKPWNDELLLCSIANSLKLLPAQLSGKQSTIKKVQLFGPSQKNDRKIKGYAATVEEVDRKLNGKRREITREEALNG